MTEVILFCGPPFSGKTIYYQQNLKSSHERISASELHRANAGWGLRNVVLEIVGILRRGKNVVVDDENWSRKMRVSYIQSIRAKVPACKFTCYVFKPAEAFDCLWRREWAMAKHFLCHDLRPPWSVDLAGTEARIRQWFEHESGNQFSGLDAVDVAEGWNQVKDTVTSLIAESNYKFEVPALFLEWGAVEDHFPESLLDGLRLWLERNVCGRLMILAILADDAAEGNDQDELGAESRYKTLLNKIQERSKTVSRKLATPIYFLIMKENMLRDTFAKPQEPGILAFLQGMHRLNVSHPGTVYLHQSKAKRLADSAQTGSRQFGVGAVCKNPNLLGSYQSRTADSAHSSLSNIGYIEESGHSQPQVLFYDKIRPENAERGTFVAEERWGRVLGVVFDDRNTFNKFQEEYAASASHISREGTRMGLRSPRQGVKRTVSGSTSADRASKGQVATDRPKFSLSSSTGGGRKRSVPDWMKPRRRESGEEGTEEVVEEEKMEKKGRTGFLSNPSPSKHKHKKSEAADTTIPKCLSLPRTMYCMTVAELRDTAKLFLQEGADSLAPDAPVHQTIDSIDDQSLIIPDTDQSDVDMASVESDEEARPALVSPTMEKEEGRTEEGEGKQEEEKEVEERRDEGVADIIKDLFCSDERVRKPPPKKKTIRSPLLASSALLWLDELPCQPDADSTASNQEQRSNPKKKQPEQDLSFLDEIF